MNKEHQMQALSQRADLAASVLFHNQRALSLDILVHKSWELHLLKQQHA